MKVRYSKMSGLQMQHWVDNMAAAVSPFSTDHAVRFAQELLGFLSSSLSITGHDIFVFGEDVQPSQASQKQQSGHEPATFLDQDRSPTSRQSSQGGVSENDSEAYVSLVHHQRTLLPTESSGLCGSETDRAEDTICPANVNQSDPGAVVLHETGTDEFGLRHGSGLDDSHTAQPKQLQSCRARLKVKKKRTKYWSRLKPQHVSA